MMKKTRIAVWSLLFTLILSLLAFGTSCTPIREVTGLTFETFYGADDVPTYEAEIGDFSLSDVRFTVSYNDGTTEEHTLTEDMLAPAEQLKFYKVGLHTIRFTFDNVIASFQLNVVRHTFDEDVYLFENQTVEYDGLPHSLRISGEIPEGVKVRYPDGNSFVDAGTYEVRAVLSKDGFDTQELKATLTITKKTIDLSDIEFSDATVVFDGLEHTIHAENLPDGVTVSYKIRSENGDREYSTATNPGVYKILASFSTADVNCILVNAPQSAKLTIEKKTYAPFSLHLENETVIYDGEEHEIILTEEQKAPVPSGIGCSFVCGTVDENGEWTALAGKPKNAGVYEYRAVFSGDTKLYNDIPFQSATLTIEKQKVSLSAVEFHSDSVVYDGEEHGIAVTESTLPTVGDKPLVSVSYSVFRTGEDGTPIPEEGTAFVHAGIYNYTLTAEICDGFKNNYVLEDYEIGAALIISQQPIEISVTPQDIRYDAGLGFVLTEKRETALSDDNISYVLTITDGAGQENTVEGAPENGKTYNYTVTFSYDDELKSRDFTLTPADGKIAFLTEDLAARFAEENAEIVEEKTYGNSYGFLYGTPDCKEQLAENFTSYLPDSWFIDVSVVLIPVDENGEDVIPVEETGENAGEAQTEQPTNEGDYRAEITISTSELYAVYEIFVTVLPPADIMDTSTYQANLLPKTQWDYNYGNDLSDDVKAAADRYLTKTLSLDRKAFTITVTTEDDTVCDKVTEAGKYKLHITFTSGNYNSISLDFEVIPRSITAKLIDKTEWEYDGGNFYYRATNTAITYLSDTLRLGDEEYRVFVTKSGIDCEGEITDVGDYVLHIEFPSGNYQSVELSFSVTLRLGLSGVRSSSAADP